MRPISLICSVACAIACGGGPVDMGARSMPPVPEPVDAAVALPVVDAAEEIVAPPAPAEVWLRGSTHVHARPSGDSRTPISEVVNWYETHGYDFIALTDHNQISEMSSREDTTGKPTIRDPATGLIVFAGSELTHNPVGCTPVLHPSRKCRIHVNVIGATARPGGRFAWADYDTRDRVAKYEAAIVAARNLGGIPQLNHPQWLWGMTADELVEIAQRGMLLYELANVQFPKWNAGDKDHLSTEALWDAALVRGARLWGVATDDAHHYHGTGRGKLVPGGGWIAVRARREPQAILDSIAAGRFYASTGVVLDRAEVIGDELVVEVAGADALAIDFIENGVPVHAANGKTARRALPANGYLRAVVTRSDGAKAWVQPVRR